MNDPASPAHLLLIPGLACDHAVWAPVLPGLTGLAQPWIPGPLDNTRIADMASAVLQQAPAGLFALAGHSMGGRVALEVVRQAPHRVLRLALLDTGWQPLPPGAAGDAERQQRMDLVALAQRSGMRAMGEQWSPPMMHPDRCHSLVYQDVLAMIERQPAERFAAQQQALLDRPDAADVLDAVRCPTLILCGQQDGWSPPQRHRQMAERIAGARLVLVPDCGHMSPMEQPGPVAFALRQWLQDR